MKTEKKSSEPSCVPPASVKEEADGANEARVKIKEDAAAAVTGGGGNQANPSDEPTNDDTPEAAALKDAAALEVAVSAAAAVGDSSVPIDSQNGQASNQAILNPNKQEQDSIGAAVEDLPSDCGGNVGIPGDTMQPMVGNVLAKQMAAGANAGEAQYMQQQSQIFVFTTQMANKGAEAVMAGQYPTIIAYHMAQPSTKKFLEKFPNKMMNFRPNHPQWLNNIGPMKQKGLQHSPSMGFPNEGPPDIPPLDPNDPFWNEQPNMRNLNGSNPLGNPDSSLDDTNINVPCLVPTSCSPNNSGNPQAIGGPAIGQSPNMMGNPNSPGSGGVQPSLQGVKIPDENLTPQQQQHRHEQLAAIAKMRQMLFREQADPNSVGPVDPTQLGPQGQLGPAGSLPPVSAPNQGGPIDWHRMQQSMNKQVGVNNSGVPVRGPGGQLPGGPGVLPPGPGSNGPPPRSQGPPPPYHQTTRSASVPIAIQSPNPSSPNNPTSNLSLPSPRASSALNSPADCNRQFQLGPTQRGQMPGQSPTSQDSPAAVAAAANANRLNHSNPGTPMSQSHLGAMSPSGTPQKDLASLDFPNSQPPNVDAMFCRSLPPMAQQKQQMVPGAPTKELMPVPSPQQISYLNAFDGQELTIQKQPNTSLKDGTNNQGNNNPDMANRMLPGAMSNSGGGNDGTNNNQYGARSEGASPSMDNSNRGFGGPLHSPHTPHTPHTPGSVAPHTPIDPAKQPNKTSSAQSSPASHNASLTDINMGPPRTPNTKSETSPTSKDQQQQQQQQQPPPPQQQQQQQQPQQMNPVAGPGGMMSPMVGPGGNGVPFGCGRPTTSQPNDNIPLNPNNMNNRMGGLGPMSGNSFDPITSLAQMSQQLTSTAPNSALGNDNSPMHAGNPAGMMGFNNPHNMHMMQMQQQQQQQQQQVNEMNGGCHIPTGAPTNEPGDVSGMCMGLGGPATSYSPTPHTGSPGMPGKIGPQPPPHHPMMQHGMMGPGPQGPGNPNVNVSQSGGYPSGPGPGMMVGPGDGGPQSRLGMPPQHMHGGPSPYNGANVQVKPNAPNTIQYLPARPNVGHAPRGPPSLDFLQRFASPGMPDHGKINSPSVNLQYFPNGCMPNNLGPQGPPPPHSAMGPGGMPPGMANAPPNQPPMGGQPMHPNMRPPGPVGRQPANIRMQQHMGGGGMFPGSPMDPDKVFPPDMLPQGALGPPPQNAYGPPPPGQKQPNMNQMGPHPPDATQPLPPSMGGGGGGPGPGFKGGHFVGSGPNMSDPNYAQQFHNFQQQLYATNSRGSGPPQGHPGMQPNAHQQFFMPNK